MELNRNFGLLKKIKTTGWDNRTKWLEANPEGKFISTYAINNAIAKQQDWDAIALRCSENPKHKFFGKTVKFIREQWAAGSKTGQKRGVNLDSYINAKLGGITIGQDEIHDEKLIKKCRLFDELHDTVLTKLHSYVGSELWLNSVKLGLSVRLDSLFTITDDSRILIAEWKNNESISTKNKWQNLLGPASHLQDTDLNKFTIQTHVYKYIFNEYGLFDEISAKVFNITSNDWTMLSEAFPYDEKFIEELVAYTRSKRQNQTKST